MKTNFLKSVLLLIISLTLFSCSSDSDETSAPVPCPQGYTGANCSTQITPSKIIISKIRVNVFPNLNGTNTWDSVINVAPDIFVRLGIGDGSNSTITLYTSNYINDALSNGSNYFDFIPTTPIELLFPTQQHVLILGDYDSASSNDLMGGLIFNPYNSNNGFPTTITISNSSIPLKFELTVSYVW